MHAKTCIVDDTWATIGSDNFNRRSWTHDSELSAVVVDTAGEYARTLRLTLAAEHLDRDAPKTTMDDCVEPAGMFAAYAECAAAPRRLARRRARSVRARRAGCAASIRPSSDAGPGRSRWRRTCSCTTRTGGPSRCARRDEF